MLQSKMIQRQLYKLINYLVKSVRIECVLYHLIVLTCQLKMNNIVVIIMKKIIKMSRDENNSDNVKENNGNDTFDDSNYNNNSDWY